MKRTVIGILAHVDAGKTTLAEAMLYCAGALRTLGRVDHGSAFLDTFSLERQRGITIFSKQALLSVDGHQFTLLDTPGHGDFSAEMERALDILDCAILVIGGSAGIQSHTRTLWRLLRKRNIPTFLFVSKMDLPGAHRAELLAELQRSLSGSIQPLWEADPEELALCDEALLGELLETGAISQKAKAEAIARGTLFPVWFGAALRLEGVSELLQGLQDYAPITEGSEDFSARVYKIARDAQGVRETHMKITGGVLRTRQLLPGTQEKITQLRLYSGSKFQAVDAAHPGDVVAVLGPGHTYAGMGLGAAAAAAPSTLVPVLTYRMLLPEGYDLALAYAQARQLEEEDPQLHVDYHAAAQELRLQIMGPVQLEVLRQLMLERFGVSVDFGQGSILYRETISGSVEGMGHYEPLRHYAQVQLLLEPGERGSGLVFDTACPENTLDRNWQRLILTHLAEKTHLGVLTGSPITDMKITLLAGKAHLKHTEGGDFRQATYRALRQGLMQAESVLLEPWFDFSLTLPQGNVGRAMTDLQTMGAQVESPEPREDMVLLQGSAPASALQEYPQQVVAYTHGLGQLSCTFRGYLPCPNQEAVVAAIGYDPEADLENSPDSIFCSHGAGHVVKWYDVPRHIQPLFPSEPEEPPTQEPGRRYREILATDQELMRIFERTYGPIRQRTLRDKPMGSGSTPPKAHRPSPLPQGPEYVLVDGYNIIFAWPTLSKLARHSLDAARDGLIELLRNYQSYRQCPVILVFDAYKVKGNPGSVQHYGGLSVVYTKEAQTADSYIEKLSYDLGKKHRVRVATSDGMEQIIILGHGALRTPALAFEKEVQGVMEEIRGYLR